MDPRKCVSCTANNDNDLTITGFPNDAKLLSHSRKHIQDQTVTEKIQLKTEVIKVKHIHNTYIYFALSF